MENHPENDPKYSGLAVNAGVAQPPVVNPYLKPRRKAPLPSASELVEGILKGDVTRLARAVTLVESVAPAHQAIAHEVIEKCLPYSGKSRRIGITGVPGAGKSTSTCSGFMCCVTAGSLPFLPSTRRRNGRKGVSSATKLAWKSFRNMSRLLSALHRRPVPSAGLPVRPVRP